uniref:Saposin A-type domain-containing protein n=1 Tax=Angiostrongylus cantonensis TaxID=6313 RepID=A0A0K0DN54_ANGCA
MSTLQHFKIRINMLLTLLLLGLSPSSADRCASVPPSLWCGSDELSKECGSEELCTRYRSAAYNKPINITLLVEALCPFCQGWVVEEFYPKVFEIFAEFINVELVPFGNAQIMNGTITCQHGPEECRINRFESCLIHVLKSQDRYVPFIYCIDNQLQACIQLTFF